MNKLYKDIDIGFNADPVSGDILTLSDVISIKRSVKMLVLTNVYERVMHPEKGSQLTGLLFDNDSMHLRMAVKDTIKSVLKQYEPRISVNDITVNVNENVYNVNIYYTIINLQTNSSVELLLNRVR